MNRFFGKTPMMRSLALAVACLTLAALTGCGGSSGNKATISGKVTYKGAPINGTGGSLTLYPSSGAPYPVGLKGDGTFSVSDVPVGDMAVAIDTGTGPIVTKEGYNGTVGSGPSGSGASPAGASAPHTDLPPKYKDPKTSGLKWDIKPGKNTKDFDLTD